MISTRKKKHQNKNLLIQLNETLNDFIIGNSTNADVAENKYILFPTSDLAHNSGESTLRENGTSHSQVIEWNVADRIKKEFDETVTASENWNHDSSLTAMDNAVVPRVEMAVRAISGSSGRGRNSKVRNPDRRDFSVNMENTSLMTACSWVSGSIV